MFPMYQSLKNIKGNATSIQNTKIQQEKKALKILFKGQ